MSSIKFSDMHMWKGGGGVKGVMGVARAKKVFGLKAILGC